MRKRILSILVSVSMALLLVPAVPFTAAAEGAAEDAADEVAVSTPSVTAREPLRIQRSSLGATSHG